MTINYYGDFEKIIKLIRHLNKNAVFISAKKTIYI